MLLQGPTSAGKTSMVQYLARTLGHKCVRINNHEHTDLQEYVGMYTANSRGQLVFQEGMCITMYISVLSCRTLINNPFSMIYRCCFYDLRCVG